MAFWMDRKAIFRMLCGSIESMLGPSKGGYMSPLSSPHYACAKDSEIKPQGRSRRNRSDQIQRELVLYRKKHSAFAEYYRR